MVRAGRPNKTDPRFNEVDWLIRKRDNESVKKILSETGIEAGDGYLRTALILATFYKNQDLLIWLIEQGANVNHQDRNGYSALHFAAQERNEVAAELLLANGINVNLPDIHGNIALWTAVFNARDNWCLVKLYLTAGANPDFVNKYQNTPRLLAATIAATDLDQL